HGRLALVGLLPTYVAVARCRARAGAVVRRRARRRQRRDRARGRAGAAAAARAVPRPAAHGGRLGLAVLAAAVALAVSPARFLQANAANGAFSEPGGTADPSLTAWAVLGLRASGADAPGALPYLQAHESSRQSVA